MYIIFFNRPSIWSYSSLDHIPKTEQGYQLFLALFWDVQHSRLVSQYECILFTSNVTYWVLPSQMGIVKPDAFVQNRIFGSGFICLYCAGSVDLSHCVQVHYR